MQRAETESPVLIGTAFFVGYPLADGDARNFIYVVTARHVIAGAQASGLDRVLLRLNTVVGATQYVATNIADWAFHPDESVADDVAILQWTPDAAVFAYKSIGLEIIATDEILTANRVGVGDDVFLPGLFVNHAGTERNLPIMRLGNIAAMPVEPVATQIGALPAYLVEARSIGGLSGSPVFVNVGLIRLPPQTVLLSTRGEGEAPVPDFLLMGLVHGHFARRPVPTDAVADGLSEETINMGIAIVLPAERIRDVLEHPRFQAHREAVGRLAAVLESTQSTAEVEPVSEQTE